MGNLITGGATMANKKLAASTGYFNKEMLAVLEKGESKSASRKPAVEKSSNKKK